MKQIVYVDYAQLAAIRKRALEEEILGIDPGVAWKKRYPHATEIEFVVGDPPVPGEPPVIDGSSGRRSGGQS